MQYQFSDESGWKGYCTVRVLWLDDGDDGQAALRSLDWLHLLDCPILCNATFKNKRRWGDGGCTGSYGYVTKLAGAHHDDAGLQAHYANIADGWMPLMLPCSFIIGRSFVLLFRLNVCNLSVCKLSSHSKEYHSCCWFLIHTVGRV